MDLRLLKADIQSNSVPTFLVFVDEEPTLCKQYIQFMADTLNKPARYYDKADQVLYDIDTNIKDDYLFIVYADDKVLKNPAYAEEFKKRTERNIVYLIHSIDKRTEFYKKNSKFVVEFPKLNNYTILAYLENMLKEGKVAVDEKKLLTLIDRCDCNLGECINETDKIIALGQTDSNLLCDYMEKDGFSDYRKTNIFNLIEKILHKDPTAFDDLTRLYDSPVLVLYNLYFRARQLLLQTKMNGFASVMKLCRGVYEDLVTGKIGDKYALKYLMLEIYR